MKYIHNSIFVALIALMGIVGCNDYEPVFQYTPKVQFSLASQEVLENGGPLVVEVQLVGEQRANPINVNFDVGGSATKGTDFNVSVDNVVTIPANASVASFTVDIVDNNQFLPNDRDIILTITGVSDGLSPGHDTESGKTMTITIVEDDCPLPPLAGTWDVSTDGCAGDGSGGCGQDFTAITNEVTITQLSATEYELSDITGGLYKNGYGDADNPATVTVNGSLITIDNQPDVVYGGDVFNGTGKINCDGTVTIEWANGYGDQGTTTFTPQ